MTVAIWFGSWNGGAGERRTRAVLKRLEQSGLSVREFAERHGLDMQRLYRWRAELSSSDSALPPPTFVEIARPMTARAPIELVLRSGVVVRVPDGFDEEELRRVLAVVDGPVGAPRPPTVAARRDRRENFARHAQFLICSRGLPAL